MPSSRLSRVCPAPLTDTARPSGRRRSQPLFKGLAARAASSAPCQVMAALGQVEARPREVTVVATHA